MYEKRTKRSQQAKQTRRAIYESASRLFAERGFQNVTVEELCRDAGVSTGAFYHHFKSKNAILTAYQESLDERYLAFYNEELTSPENETVPVPDRLFRFLSFILLACVDRGVDYERIVYSNIISDPAFSKSMIDPERSYYHLMRSLLLDGQKRGEITRSLSADRMVGDITMLCRGVIVDWCVNDGKDDIVAHAASFLRCYITGIRSDRSGR